MASTRARIPTGSAPWIVSESRQAAEIIAQDVEEFSYSVCNDMEWLNEHMAEIFAPGNVNVVSVFKTPGKLRGKTPRTIKKRAPPGTRAPLTDIFAPNPQASTPSRYALNKPPNPIHIAEDAENQHGLRQSPPKMAPLTRIAHTDSGYHGSTDDEMDIDKPVHNIALPYVSPMRVVVAQDAPATTADAEQRRSLSESFVSAKEILGSRKTSQETAKSPIVENVETVEVESHEAMPASVHIDEPAAVDDQMALDDIQSPPESPSPVKQVVRKSSLTFAALPAREPLAKTSFGARASQSSKSFGARNSQLRMTGSRITGGASHAAFSFTGGDTEIDINMQDTLGPEDSDTTKLHNKTSTQRLHDRINMLGQARDVRTSQLHASTDKPLYSLLPHAAEKPSEEPSKPIGNQSTISLVRQVEEDDWIAPLGRPTTAFESSMHATFPTYDIGKAHQKTEGRIGATESPGRSFLYKKNASTTVLESPTKAAMAPDASLKPISVSNPAQTFAAGTTTPSGSPPRSPSGRKLLEGPLSASKAKFYSVLKSAKGIFASSAGVSAHAKMEALSPGRLRKQAYDDPPRSPGPEVDAMPAYFPHSRPASPAQVPPSPIQEGRRTRSSTEQKRKEEERKRQLQRSADELDKAREKERQKATAAAVQKTNRAAAPSRIAGARPGALSRAAESKETLRSDPDDIGPPPPPKNNLPANSQRLREPRRVPVPRSNKEAASKLKPAPVTVRMPSQRLGPVPPSNVALNQSLQDTLPPPPPPKTGMATKTITAHPNTSATSLRSNAGSVKRTFAVAAKKKEMETKHAQRKAEQKRTQRIEEERKLEQQRKAAEQQRVQEARKAAQRKAEEAKRLEQQRAESRQNALATAMQQEKSNQHPRGDIGAARPLSKMTVVQDQRPIIQVNPAKPPKRAHPIETDEQDQQRSGPSFQQIDAKRRKTDEEEPVPAQRSSVMAPPIRHSTIRKDPNKFHSSYLQNHGAQHGSQAMLIKTVTSQHMQHSKSNGGEMAKFANGRIPFADAPNPPAAPMQSAVSQMQHKTPVRPGGHAAPTPAAKSSPQYPLSESIILPEINTDSEDDDDDAEKFQAPDWTRTPELRALLEKQQLVDPETVFGPIAPLHMEEVFSRGSSKERLKKFRERTSSANWNGADRLTEEERRKDRKARERLMRDGGWDFRNQKEALGENSPNA